MTKYIIQLSSQLRKYQQAIGYALLGMVASLWLIGCGTDSDYSAGGPGVGGTGPLITMSNEILLARSLVLPEGMRGDGSDDMTQEPNIGVDTDASDTGDMDNGTDNPSGLEEEQTPPTPQAPSTDNSERHTFQIATLDSPNQSVQCLGVQQTLSLVDKNQQPLTDVTLQSLQPLYVLATIENTTDQETVEQRYDCQSFDLQDSNGESQVYIEQPCQNALEEFVYLPKQTHHYQLSLILPEQAGIYRLKYLNKLQGAKQATSVCPELYLDLEVRELKSATTGGFNIPGSGSTP